MIDKEHPLPITEQCKILQISRSSIYYGPVPLRDKDREFIRLIDEIHLEDPLSWFKRNKKHPQKEGL